MLSRLSFIAALGMMTRISSQFEKTRKVRMNQTKLMEAKVAGEGADRMKHSPAPSCTLDNTSFYLCLHQYTGVRPSITATVPMG